jgi:hypothetical protein
MNLKVEKYAKKIGVGVAAALVMGTAYKLERDTQTKIDEQYDDKKDEAQETDV